MFLPDGTFVPLPKLASEPFLKLWEQEVFALLLAEGKINDEVVANPAPAGLLEAFGIQRDQILWPVPSVVLK